MARRLFAAIMVTGVVIGTAAVLLANPPATYVLRNGDRVSGELTYKGGAEFSLIINGKERDFSPDDVVLMEFAPGNPSTNELRQLPTENDPPELQRHMIVTRDGRVIHGKLYHISREGETITYDTTEGSQPVRGRTIPTSQVARLYISAPAARSVYSNILRGDRGDQAVATSGSASGTIEVPANQAWTDTGITVRRGERVAFQATGQIRLAPSDDPNFTANPGGNGGTITARTNLPVPALPSGALIGRIGNSRPFAIGSSSNPLTMPAAGRLMVGINDDDVSDNSGAFAVRVAH